MLKKAAHDPARDTQTDALLAREAEAHRRTFESLLEGLRGPFVEVLDLWHSAILQGGKLLAFGNGGSAGNAQHIAAELAIRYEQDRPPIAAVALTADSLVLSAAANDLGFDAVFSRQVAALGNRGDVAVGISTSGASANVIAGLREARARGLHTTGLIGREGGAMLEHCDAAIIVPSHVTARIQEMHLFVTHLLCKSLEVRLGLAPGTPR